MKPAKSYECVECNDSGVVARFASNGKYAGPGPVPEDARRYYEDLCGCPEGMKARREERMMP